MHVSLWNIVLQVVNFLVLAWLLKRFLFKPVRAVLQRRADAALATTREAEVKRAEAERVVAEYRAKTDAIDTEAARARERALASVEQEASRQRRETHDSCEREMAAARAALEQERIRALHALEVHAADLAVTMAERILREMAPPSDAPFLWRATASVDALDEPRRAAVAREVGDGGVAAISSRPLDEPTRRRFESWLSSLAGKPVHPSYRVDDSLIAGVEVRLPTAIWRAHLRELLERMHTELVNHATTT